MAGSPTRKPTLDRDRNCAVAEGTGSARAALPGGLRGVAVELTGDDGNEDTHLPDGRRRILYPLRAMDDKWLSTEHVGQSCCGNFLASRGASASPSHEVRAGYGRPGFPR